MNACRIENPLVWCKKGEPVCGFFSLNQSFSKIYSILFEFFSAKDLWYIKHSVWRQLRLKFTSKIRTCLRFVNCECSRSNAFFIWELILVLGQAKYNLIPGRRIKTRRSTGSYKKIFSSTSYIWDWEQDVARYKVNWNYVSYKVLITSYVLKNT